MRTNRVSVLCLAFGLYMAFGSTGWGQATRTWVSGVGDDANPCSRTAPCKTFAGAISKTAAGGEIDALDPGGFGAVTITKAITIDGTGTLGSILAAGTNGIVVSAGANDVIIIRGISINGAGSGVNGIRFLTGGSLHVEACTIFGFTGNGISFEPSAASQLSVLNTTIEKTSLGILVRPASTGSAQATIEGCATTGNTAGIRVDDGSVAFIKNTTAAGNANNGFLASSYYSAAEIDLESCMASGNGTNGVKSWGPYSTVRLSNVTAMGNTGGLSTASSGVILSYVNNKVAGNVVDGAPTGTIVMQ
jgi:hypothetical protein